MNTASRIARMASLLDGMRQERILVTIDGPCGSGKSTLAAALGEALAAPVVHMDDYVIPHAQKTAERLAIPGGNADLERLLAEVIRPWLAGKPAIVRQYLCHELFMLFSIATAFTKLNRNAEADAALDAMWRACEAHDAKWARHFRTRTILLFARLPGRAGYAIVGGAYKLANKVVRFN